MRMENNGHQVIRVSTLGEKSDAYTWSYEWCGNSRLSIGDHFVLQLDKRDWEVEVVGLGTEYLGPLTKIGGEYGLSYSLKS